MYLTEMKLLRLKQYMRADLKIKLRKSKKNVRHENKHAECKIFGVFILLFFNKTLYFRGIFNKDFV